MKQTKVVLAAALIVGSLVTRAAAPAYSPNTYYQFSNVECTQVGTDVHITCKLSDAATGDQAELPTSLINYDVKDKNGNILSSGFGSSVSIDESKMGTDEEYSINVYALVNGTVVSQTINRKVGAAK